jgi:hypothetical protein
MKKPGAMAGFGNAVSEFAFSGVAPFLLIGSELLATNQRRPTPLKAVFPLEGAPEMVSVRSVLQTLACWHQMQRTASA